MTNPNDPIARADSTLDLEIGSLGTWVEPGCKPVPITRVRSAIHKMRIVRGDLQRAKAQRDDLLAALKEAQRTAKAITNTELHGARYMRQMASESIFAIEAAIANAKRVSA